MNSPSTKSCLRHCALALMLCCGGPLLAHCGDGSEYYESSDNAYDDELEADEPNAQERRGRVRCNNNYDCVEVGGETVGLKVVSGVLHGGAKVKVFERPRRRDDVHVELQTWFYKNGQCLCRMEVNTVGEKSTSHVIWGEYKVGVGVNGECDPYFEDCEITGPTGSAGIKPVRFDGVFARARIRNDGEHETLEGSAGNVDPFDQCFAPCF